MAAETPKLKSYVWHDGQCFFVSTIERDSSAMMETPVSRFHETIVWEYDWDTAKRGTMVAQEGCGTAFDQHYRVCKDFYETGKLNDEDE
jgi:hypothetical protein